MGRAGVKYMKLILQILLILLILATISVCFIQPDLHKNIIVYDSSYTLVTEEEVKTEIKEIPVMEKPAKPVQSVVKVETKVTPVKTTAKTKSVNTQKQTKVTPKQTQTKQQTTKSAPQKTVTKPETTSIIKTKPAETVKIETPKIKNITVTKPIEQHKTLTQQEETIAWNKWRSNLTNQIMQDTKLPDIPNGTIFQFSFNVDKYGKITNVQTGANPANYTPYAIQYIAPVIRSYQGRSILNFPEGTARTSTQVTGKWRISNSQKFSTPQDYNDVEKIIR